MKKLEPAIKTQATQEALKGQVLPQSPTMPALEWYFQWCVEVPACLTSYSTEGGRASPTQGPAQIYPPYSVFF